MAELEKSQKLKKKKTGKRCYKAFIHNVSWWYDGINLRLTTIKDNYAKKMYNNFRYHLGKDNIEIVYIVEGKQKRIHVHGYIDVSRLEGQQYILKQSASTYKNEYSQSQYRNMLQIKDGYNEYKGGSYGWFRYMKKGNHSENGLYFSRALLERVRENYQALYKQYKKIIQQLKADNIKITYKQDTPEESA